MSGNPQRGWVVTWPWVILNTFPTVQPGPPSSLLCSCCPRTKGLENSQLKPVSKRTSCCLRNKGLENSQLKPVSKWTSYWWRESSITSYCVVLMFKSAKIWRLVKELLVSETLGIFFPQILIASIKMMTRTMHGCLILNKLGRRRKKLCPSDGNTAMLAVEMRAFLLGFSCPIPALLLLAPVLLGQLT